MRHLSKIVLTAFFAATLSAQPAGWLNNASGTNTATATNSMSPKVAPVSNPSANVSAPTSGVFESNTLERMSDRAFDVNKDSLNLEDGTLHWKGKTFNMGNSRIVRARFEKYLSMPVDTQNFQAYQAILSEISARLSASNDRLPPEALRACWTRLFDAAEYDVDGKASLTIANLVYLSWRMRGEFDSAKAAEIEQKSATKEVKRSAESYASYLEYANDKIVRMNSSGSNKRGEKRTEGAARLGYLTQDLQSEVVLLASKKASKELTAAKAVLQFQSQIVAFLAERKFQQAQIASMFYRHIYRGNVQDLRVGKEQINDLMSIKEFLPTVDMLENVSIEMRKDIQDGMSAVNALFGAGERYGALQRLMETFAIGEFDPILTVFPFEKRKVLHKIYKDTATIKELADSRDWGGIEEIVEDLKKDAEDFPYREILAKVRAAERISEMHIMAAKQAAALGKIDDVKTSLTAAMQAWPLNPEIKSFNTELLGLAAGTSQYVQKFDDLLSRKNYREIFREASEYAIVLKNDAERAAKLKEIVVKLSQIDSLIAQAEEFQKQNNAYFSWDILENARAIDPDDPQLALALAKLAPEVSDYVKMLSRASTAEKNGNFAAALNYYLAAQEIFPASQSCRIGISRTAPKY